jgi:hypothetical protein
MAKAITTKEAAAGIRGTRPTATYPVTLTGMLRSAELSEDPVLSAWALYLASCAPDSQVSVSRIGECCRLGNRMAKQVLSRYGQEGRHPVRLLETFGFRVEHGSLPFRAGVPPELARCDLVDRVVWLSEECMLRAAESLRWAGTPFARADIVEFVLGHEAFHAAPGMPVTEPRRAGRPGAALRTVSEEIAADAFSLALTGITLSTPLLVLAVDAPQPPR